jgi:transcriptional regulator with XRE-family HTH domain
MRHVLARVRIGAKLQQKELAHLTGVATVTIKKIESCVLPLSESLAQKIGEHLGVSPAYLLKNNLRRQPVTDTGAPWNYTTYRYHLLEPLQFWNEKATDVSISLALFRIYARCRGALRQLKDPMGPLYQLESLLDEACEQFLKEYPQATNGTAEFLDDVIADAEFLRSNLPEDVIEGYLEHDLSGHSC